MDKDEKILDKIMYHLFCFTIAGIIALIGLIILNAFISVKEIEPNYYLDQEPHELSNPPPDEMTTIEDLEWEELGYTEQIEPKQSVNLMVYTQSKELFYIDNQKFRNDSNKVSFQGEYWDYQELINEYNVDSLAFVPNDSIFKSGDILTIDNSDYLVIDNKSNCGVDCVEILTEDLYKEEKVVYVK